MKNKDLKERLSDLLRAEAELERIKIRQKSIGSLGGQARAKKLSAAQRSEIARHAANTRWRRYFRNKYKDIS